MKTNDTNPAMRAAVEIAGRHARAKLGCLMAAETMADIIDAAYAPLLARLEEAERIIELVVRYAESGNLTDKFDIAKARAYLAKQKEATA